MTDSQTPTGQPVHLDRAKLVRLRDSQGNITTRSLVLSILDMLDDATTPPVDPAPSSDGPTLVFRGAKKATPRCAVTAPIYRTKCRRDLGHDGAHCSLDGTSSWEVLSAPKPEQPPTEPDRPLRRGDRVRVLADPHYFDDRGSTRRHTELAADTLGTVTEVYRVGHVFGGNIGLLADGDSRGWIIRPDDLERVTATEADLGARADRAALLLAAERLEGLLAYWNGDTINPVVRDQLRVLSDWMRAEVER